jgi:hypothetical protein
MAANIPCSTCPKYDGIRSAPGSFLKPLTWWDIPANQSLARQLDIADSTLLRYEAERHIAWLLKDLENA